MTYRQGPGGHPVASPVPVLRQRLAEKGPLKLPGAPKRSLFLKEERASQCRS